MRKHSTSEHILSRKGHIQRSAADPASSRCHSRFTARCSPLSWTSFWSCFRWKILFGPILWGHSGPLCHVLSLSLASSWTSMRRRHATVLACDSSDTWWMGVRRLAVAKGPNIFQMLLVLFIRPASGVVDKDGHSYFFPSCHSFSSLVYTWTRLGVRDCQIQSLVMPLKMAVCIGTVSYTHLTLPTILRV